MNDAAEIHNLKKRITYLESLLTVHNISFDTPDVPSPQSAPVPVSVVITPAHARFFFSLFHGRSDVYAKRAVMKSGRITKLQNTTRKTAAQSVVSIAAVQPADRRAAERCAA